MAPRQPAWELWRAEFRRRVTERYAREGLTQQTLADAMGYRDKSSVNYHLAGRGPSLEFCEKIAELWPDEFSDAATEWHAAKSGKSLRKIEDLHATAILLALDAIDNAVSSLRSAVESALSRTEEGAKGEDQP